jgi:hypothetical protein
MSVYPNFVKLWNFGAYGWLNPVALRNMTDVLAGRFAGGHSTVWLFHNEPKYQPAFNIGTSDRALVEGLP